MRRPRYTGEAAVNEAVYRILNKFEYPDELGGGAGFAGVGAGGDPSILIAASDATPQSKEMAHFVATGVRDDELINAALDILVADGPAEGGRIVLSEGNFHCRPDEIIVTSRMHLHGLGAYRTFVRPNGAGTASHFLVAMQTDGELSRIGFNTSGVSYVGSVIDCDFGRITNITHTGPAVKGIYFSGGQKPNSNIELNGNYSTAGIHIDGIRVKLDNVIINTSSGAGPRILIDNTATQATVITNLTIINSAGGLGNGIETDGSSVTIDGFEIRVPGAAGIHVNDGAPADHVITNGIITAETGILMDGGFPSLDDSVISNLIINPTGAGMEMYALRRSIVSNVGIHNAGEHGISLDEFSSDNQIQNNLIYRPGGDTDNTFDGIILVASADNNYLHGNLVIGRSSGNQPRYAINVAAASCDDNAVVGNNFSDPGGTDYGTARFNDAGTGTITLWSSGGPNGDNIN